MNAEWFGDSYDVVKRFFVGTLRDLGFRVYVDPMATGDWQPHEEQFLGFLGGRHVREAKPGNSALLLDPDTGIGRRRSARHITIQDVVSHTAHHQIVFVFDQSFSRGPTLPQLHEKLEALSEARVNAFYYHSHAHFLFASRSPGVLATVHEGLTKTGLPAHRLVSANSEARSPTRRCS